MRDDDSLLHDTLAWYTLLSEEWALDSAHQPNRRLIHLMTILQNHDEGCTDFSELNDTRWESVTISRTIIKTSTTLQNVIELIAEFAEINHD